MSILEKVERFFTRKAKGVLSVAFIESLEKGNLLGDGELFPAAFSRLQAESTAVIGTPLALATVGAGVFFSAAAFGDEEFTGQDFGDFEVFSGALV